MVEGRGLKMKDGPDARIDHDLKVFITPKELREIADKMDADYKENSFPPTGWSGHIFSMQNEFAKLTFYNSVDRHRKQVGDA